MKSKMDRHEKTEDGTIKWDVKTFHEIYQSYFKILTVYAFRILHDEEAARDAVQEVFSYLWENKVELRNKIVLKVYLYKGVRNNALKYIVRHHLEQAGNESFGQHLLYHASDEEEEDIMDYEDLFKSMLDRIEALPDRQREVLLMALKGKKAKDISEALNLSVETVRTHRKRAIAQLRSLLSTEERYLLIFLLTTI